MKSVTIQFLYEDAWSNYGDLQNDLAKFLAARQLEAEKVETLNNNLVLLIKPMKKTVAKPEGLAGVSNVSKMFNEELRKQR